MNIEPPLLKKWRLWLECGKTAGVNPRPTVRENTVLPYGYTPLRYPPCGYKPYRAVYPGINQKRGEGRLSLRKNEGSLV